MFNNIVLLSAVQQHESEICIHISPPSCISFSPQPPSHVSRSSQSTELSFLCYKTASHQLFYTSVVLVVVQALQCLICCFPMDCSMPGSPVLHYVLEVAQIHVHLVNDAIQPSHTLPPPSPFPFNLSQHQVFYTWKCIYISMLLSHFVPPSPSLTVSTNPFSMSSSLFLPCKQIHQYHFFQVPYICINIKYLFL